MNITNLFLTVSLVLAFPAVFLSGLFNPSLGLGVLLFLLPALNLAFRLFNSAPYPSLETIAIVVLCIGTLGHAAIQNKKKQKIKNAFTTILSIENGEISKGKQTDFINTAAISIFLVTSFISSFFAVNADLALKIWFTGALSPLLCYLLATRYIRTPADSKWLLYGIFGLVIQVAIFTALAWGQRQVIAPQNEDLVTWLYLGANPVNIFGSPSAAIATLVISIPMAAWYRVYGSKNNNLIWGVVSVSALGVAAMSLSRGSWVGILFALVASLPLYFKRIQIRVIILITLFLLGFYFSGYYDFIFNLFDNRLSSQINTVDIRIANYQLALQASINHVFLGLGLGHYQYVYGEFPFASASHMQSLWFAHSLFLTLIPEIGLTGALAFAYIFISRLIKGLILYRKLTSDYDRWFVFSLLAAIFAYIVVVSSSGGHLIATLSDYLTAPGLIVVLTFMGCLSPNSKRLISVDQISL